MRNCGAAEVTPEGKKLLSRFRTLEKELNKTADALLQAWREEDANLETNLKQICLCIDKIST